jgi:hypothetical protein
MREGDELRPCGPCLGVGEGWGRVLPVSGASSMTADYPIPVLFQSLVRFLQFSFFLPFPLVIPYELKIRFPYISVRFCITMPFLFPVSSLLDLYPTRLPGLVCVNHHHDLVCITMPFVS